MTSAITSKGWITVPKTIRDAPNLQLKDHLEFLLEPDGTVRIAAAVTRQTARQPSHSIGAWHSLFGIG